MTTETYVVTPTSPPSNYIWVWADKVRVQPGHPLLPRVDLAAWRLTGNGNVETRYVRGHASPSPVPPEVGTDWIVAAYIDRPAGSIYTLPEHVRSV